MGQKFYKVEIKIIWMIQKDVFSSNDYDRLKTLGTFKDEDGIYIYIRRVKIQILCTQDKKEFLPPIFLSFNPDVVNRLVLYFHDKVCHPSSQILLNLLR